MKHEAGQGLRLWWTGTNEFKGYLAVHLFVNVGVVGVVRRRRLEITFLHPMEHERCLLLVPRVLLLLGSPLGQHAHRTEHVGVHGVARVQGATKVLAAAQRAPDGGKVLGPVLCAM